MALGMKTTNNKRSAIVQVDYIVHIKEIRPWPPSQSFNSLRSVLIHWDNGSNNSGSTSLVVPTIGSVVGEGRIEFNESFKLSVALPRVMSLRSTSYKTFQKNCIEFNLYEPRRDKVRGQLLGTAIIDLADYGILNEPLSISAPLNCKRNFRNVSQPILFVEVQPLTTDSPKNASSRNSLSREFALDKSGDGESVFSLMNEEYAEEAAVTSVADDDRSFRSSLTVAASAYESNEGLISLSEGSSWEFMKERILVSLNDSLATCKDEVQKSNVVQVSSGRRSQDALSPRLLSVMVSRVNANASFSNLSASTLPSVASKRMNQESNNEQILVDKTQKMVTLLHKESEISTTVHERLIKDISNYSSPLVASLGDDPKFGNNYYADRDDDGEAMSHSTSLSTSEDTVERNFEYVTLMKDVNNDPGNQYEKQIQDANAVKLKDAQINCISGNFSREQVRAGIEAHSSKKYSSEANSNKTMGHVNSLRSLSNSGITDGSERCYRIQEQANEVHNNRISGAQLTGEGNVMRFHSEGSVTFNDCTAQILEHKIKILQGELRDAAAMEAALYSIVAEHGSNTVKVHTPARRLSRLYLHACEEKSRASAAKTAVSGLVLVAKACGNDVPRLTYWLSNCVVLRAIVSLATGHSELPVSTGIEVERERGNISKKDGAYSSNCEKMKQKKRDNVVEINDWDDSATFLCAMEKVEGWIFSKIVESLWWQTLAPYMQSSAKSNSRPDYMRVNGSNDEGLSNFSVELWKEAFKDACESLCPVRAAGHDCGCLSMLSRLIMEQCVVRLDVAMFNAFFRDSIDDKPTDPVSDPIGDSKVLPFIAGKSSFGAGAQLKTAIGNWSRCLSELFGLADYELPEDESEQIDEDNREDASPKCFYLLHTLSDIMMLPKDLLLQKSVRKEVCPSFRASLIKRLLDTYVPDEFCPDPVPNSVLEALEYEDSQGGESIANVPYSAPIPIYFPPSADSLACLLIGETGHSKLRKTGSSILKKSYTSDDELDELVSPLSTILMGAGLSSATSKQRTNENEPTALRYQLLREVWINSL